MQTFQSMVSRMMQKKVSSKDIEAIKEHIKLLVQLMLMLSVFNDSKSVPKICSQSNALGLMNLIPQMINHGSLRNTWDGYCEELIQGAKPCLTNRRKAVGCYASRLSKLLRDGSLDSLMTDFSEDCKKEMECQEEMKSQRSRAGSMPQVYCSCSDAQKCITNGDGLSGIVNQRRCFVLVNIKLDNPMVEKHEVVFLDGLGVVRNDTHFCPIQIKENTSNPSLVERDKLTEIEQFVSATPPKPEKGEDFTSVQNESGIMVNRCCLVTDRWKERDCNGDMVLPLPDYQLLERIKTFFSHNLESHLCYCDLSWT